ncbi:MarR family winged helix-turn-helix transcriptional regulator [Fructilactobacillus hinvesii]|uniref:MarR family winged helix-turn-helix transcriptional regulator n=1 Tax=Fructilactobacillus hinvesii TaxID=2940300 RepID=A0ABY5BQR4_9LACO|nr:MarR family winged helix-turn-helix transcriptional regulator [Fructilactobacillus hinvesii]USS87445.1 MarR family winged helix-turn-helix transcriptional regulator [Fructilactobacillus hinvesii]
MKNSLEALRAVSKIHQHNLQMITKAHHLTISEWQLLIAINSGNDTQEKLSQAMKLDTSTLSRQLKRLLVKEMIDKHAVGDDHRQLVYHLTEQGQTELNDVNAAYDQLQRQIFSQWTTDESNLLKILLNRLETSMKRLDKRGV